MKDISPPHVITPEQRRQSLVRAGLVTVAFTALVWWIHFFNWFLDANFQRLGVRPGDVDGLIGLLTAPLIHGDWEHLVANTPALVILGTLTLYSYPRASKLVIPLVWVGSGLGIWLFGQSGTTHFGASGLTHGLMFFLFVIGILRKDRRATAISMAVFFLYGSMVMTIFPREVGISWEAHLFGAVVGLVLAILLRAQDPLPPRKTYEWEEQPEEEDPVIGDLWRKKPGAVEVIEPDEDDEGFPISGDDEERWH
ncbi:MAG: rhomboid family intramembrane serine protease [Gammaproteobacteria bacterium]|nr:rhomboid family intramembrane serine protease [Gammaproteobacteria bacterium]